MMAWYIAYCNARAEAAAAARLTELGFQTLYLHYAATTRHARKTRHVIRPLYPRYIFVGLSPTQGLYSVNSAQGVSQVLKVGEAPVAVPAAVMGELFAKGDAAGLVSGIDEPAKRRLFKTRQRIRVDIGPFLGFIGQVESDSGKEVRVWLEILKRRTLVTLGPEGLSPIDAARLP